MAKKVVFDIQAKISGATKKVKDLGTAADKTSKDIGKINKETSKTTQLLTKAGVAMAGFVSVAAIGSLVKQVITVRAEFEKFDAVLTNTLGSAKLAAIELGKIKDFAAVTPFSVTQLTNAFVKLTNQGLKPTIKELRQYGDLASSVGKEFDQLAEAIIDATVGEFERLKEFGIKAKQSGDKVSFTFKEVTTEVDKTSKAIKNYITGLGDMQGVSGAMEAISKTLGGKISNLGDAWDSLLNTMGQRGSGILTRTIGFLGEMIIKTENLIKITETQQQEVKKTYQELDTEIGILINGNFTLEERKGIIQDLNTQYGDYIANLIDEESSIDDLIVKRRELNKEMLVRVLILDLEKRLGEEAEIQLRLAKGIIETKKRQAKAIMEVETSTAFAIATESRFNEQMISANKEMIDSSGDRKIAIIDDFKSMASELGFVLDDILAQWGKTDDEIVAASTESTVKLNKRQLALKKKLDAENLKATSTLLTAEGIKIKKFGDFEIDETKRVIDEKVALAGIGAELTSEIKREQAEEDAAIFREGQLTQLAIAADLAFGLSQLFEEGSAAHKAFAITTALIDTYLGAQKAYVSALATLTPAGLFGAPIAAAAAIAFGLANVAKIASFQEGGFTGLGKGFKDKDGKIAGYVHENEFVFNPQKTRMLRPLFEDIHNDRINISGLAKLTRGDINNITNNEFNARVLEREVGRIYDKMGVASKHYAYSDDNYMYQVRGNTTTRIRK